MIHYFHIPSDKIIPMNVSVFLKKIFARPRAKARQAGQAILEYILVLVIIVSLILGIMYQFNDAFKNFLDNYFGDYIACLLETGELPSLGGSGPTSAECISPYANFSLASGNAPGGTSGNGSGSGNGSSSSNGSSSDTEGSSSDGSKSGSGSSSRAGSRSRPASINSRGGTSNAEGGNRASRGSVKRIKRTVGGNSVSGSPSGFGGDSTDSGGRIGRRSRTIRKKRIIYLGDSYLTEDAKKKKKNPVISKGKQSEKAETVSNLRQPKFTLKLPEERALASEDDNSGFSFGTLLKFLLIGGILIAIFIFLGGQAVQIKKSWQKAE